MEKKSLYIMRDTDGVKGFFPSSTERAVIGTFTYDAQRMGAAPAITATLMYSRCLDKEWTHNEYVEFGSERYYVKQTPSSSKNNTDQRYKHEITFVSEREILENVYFLDVVTSDTEEQYQDRYRSNSSKIHFYGDIQEFVARLNDSLIYSGLYDKAMNEGYHVVIDEGITSETKDVSIEDKFIAEALQDIYNIYELAYYWVGKTCHVGYTENAIAIPIEYGSDNALISVQKANANYRIINRITGMGGATNIPWYYPNMNAEGNASYETENIEKSDVIKISLNEILKYNNSPYTTYTLLKVTNPDACANAGNLAPFYDTYNPTILGDREVSATSRKGKGEVRTYITMSFRLKVKAQKGDKLLFSFKESFLSFRKIEGNANVSLSWQKVTSSSFGGDNNLKTKIYIGTWSDYYKPNETDATGEYIEVSSTWTNYEYTFYTSGWFQIVITGTVYAIFPESDPINSWATIGMSLNPKSSITYQKSNNGQYFFSYGQDEDVAYGESGITLANIDNAPFIPSHFEFINGEWVAIEDEGEAPAIINITGREWITPSQNLMPSIYRESVGAERYYNAVNNMYDDGNGGKYTFNNQYDKTNPREGTTTFEDIIPTISGIKNSKGQLIGEIADVQFDTDDSDILKADSDEYLHSYFYIKLHIFDGEGGFNLFEHALVDDEAAIEMTSGNCAACRFVIGVDKYLSESGTAYEFCNPVITDEEGNLRKVNSSNAAPYEGDYILPTRNKDSYVPRQQDTSKYEVWIAVKKETDTFGIIMPNAPQGYRPSIGDTFVITGISLPESYINEAEKRLDAALIAYMKANNDFKFTFTVNLSRIFLANNESFASKLNENARVILRYNNEEHVLYVSNYTCKADDEILYEVTVDLTDTLVVAQSALSAQFDAVKSEILSSLQGMRSDVLAQGLKYFLRKDTPDTARELITFLKGLQSISKVYLGGGAEFGSFMSGFLGFGAKIDDGGRGEMESLTLRRELIVPQLSYNRVDIKVGDKWRAPGGGVIASVDTVNKRCTLRLAEGEIGAVAAGDICMGIFHSEVGAENAVEDTDDGLGNRTFAGFTTVYFRIETVEGSHNEAFTYSLRPVSERWKGQAEPMAEMQFVAYGSFSDEGRQTSVYETRTYTRMLWKQNTWEIAKANIALQYGDLSNLSVFEMQMQGYSMYLNSVYFTGEITQVKPDGTPVRTANDRGAWQQGHYDYYDRVSHDGSLWLCVAEGGTDSEPRESDAAWLKQVDRGEDGAPGETWEYLGEWREGMHVPYMGVVRYGGATYTCVAEGGSDNPPYRPYFALACKDGSLITTADGARLLGGGLNPEYRVVVTDGEPGRDGADGVPGTPGKDGKTLYTWIKYADDAGGGGISNDPTGKEYIGLAYNKETATESDDPADYAWSRIKGEQGVPGTKGDDGTQYYTWIAYSDNADGSGMYQQPKESTLYIGIAVNKTTPTESDDPADYTWSRFKGEKGDDGKDGEGVNANLLDDTEFASESRMSAWTEGSRPTGDYSDNGIHEGGPQGANYYRCGTWMTEDELQFKDIIQQTVGDRLSKGEWHTLSFWSCSDADWISVNETSAAYGFGLREVRLTAGHRYRFGGNGRVSAAAAAAGVNLVVMIYNADWSWSKEVSITSQADSTVLSELDDVPSTGAYNIRAYASTGTDGETTEVTANSYILQDLDGVMSTYIYPGVVDSGAGGYIDGEWTDSMPSGQGVRWPLDSGWARHTLTFKTLGSFDASTHVLFRLWPSPCRGTAVWADISRPKLETGQSATAYMPGGSDMDGREGQPGCVLRVSEWALGTVYRNDVELATDGVRYLDIAMMRNDASTTGWDAYQCLKTHTSTILNRPISTQGGTYWSKFGANVGAIFTSLIIAKNAKIRFLQGNSITVEKDDGTVTAGMQGSTSGDKTRFWAGSAVPDEAPFRVDEEGKMTAENAVIAGYLYKSKTVLTRDNIDDFKIDADDMFTGQYLDLKKTGTWIEFSDLASGQDIYMPSIYPYDTSMTEEEKDYVRSLVGNTILLYNRSSYNVTVTANNKESEEAGPVSFGIRPGWFAAMECKASSWQITSMNPEAKDYEDIYWLFRLGKIR